MTGPESRETRGKLHCCYHLAVTSNKIEQRNAKEGPCHAPSSPTPNPAENGIQNNASPDFRQLYKTSRIINYYCGTHFTQYYLISITSLLLSISIGPRVNFDWPPSLTIIYYYCQFRLAPVSSTWISLLYKYKKAKSCFFFTFLITNFDEYFSTTFS